LKCCHEKVPFGKVEAINGNPGCFDAVGATAITSGLYAAVEVATQEGAGPHTGKAGLIASLCPGDAPRKLA
jgi:hypothetical protein